MRVDYEYEEKLFLQFATEEIDLLETSIKKLQDANRKIGFRKNVINKDELELYGIILEAIDELRNNKKDDKETSNKETK